MAKGSDTHIFRGRNNAEVLAQAKSALGDNLEIVKIRPIYNQGLFDKLTSKLGGAAAAVELEVAIAEPAAPQEPVSQPAVRPNQALVKSYNLALEGRDRVVPPRPLPHDPDLTVQLGSTRNGLNRQLSQMTDMLAHLEKLTQAGHQNMLSLVSLQARGGMPQVGPGLLQRYNDLLKMGINEETARSLLEEIQTRSPNLEGDVQITAALRAAVAHRLACVGPALMREGGPVVIAFVGPSGVGKSSCLSKLALLHGTRLDHRVGIINEDIHRPAAQQQFDNFNRLFKIPVITANNKKSMQDAIREMQDMDVVFIDTGGRSPRDAAGIARLGGMLEAAGANEIHLHLSAVSSERAMAASLEAFRQVGFNRVVFTKLDECTALGQIVNVAKILEQGISYLTTGADSIPHIRTAESTLLADYVLGLRDVMSEGKEKA